MTRHASNGEGRFRALEPFSSDREYFNFPGLYEEGDAGPSGIRLVRSRTPAVSEARYDPDSLFRLNHNIPPS